MNIERKRMSLGLVSGLQIYLFDPAHDDETFPGAWDGKTLSVTDPTWASECLTEAANSADDDNDREVRDALTALARRVRA